MNTDVIKNNQPTKEEMIKKLEKNFKKKYENINNSPRQNSDFLEQTFQYI